MKTTLVLAVITVFLCSLAGCGSSAGDNVAPDTADKAGSASDPAKAGKADLGHSAPELPPPPIGK